LENKYQRHGDLSNFKVEVKEHFERYGMLPVTYRDDTANETDVASVLDAYSKFRLPPLRENSKKIFKHYDPYAKSDDVCGKLLLFASLEATLSAEVRKLTKPTDTFPDVWMIFIGKVTSTSSNRHKKPRQKICLSSPPIFPDRTSRVCASSLTNGVIYLRRLSNLM
jgi:hypothetical protein